MDVELIPEWRLSPDDDRAVADLLAQCFETDFSGRSYFIQRPHLRLIFRAENTLLAHMALVFRSIRQGHKLIPICGLADVACAPAARGTGLASRLLREAISIASHSDAGFVLLFGNAALYGANGFHAMPNRVFFTAMGPGKASATESETSSDLMVRNLGKSVWDAKSDVDLMGHIF